MSRRERLEHKLEKREEWAAARDRKAAALRASTPESLRRDWAFITQPGHIPERARMIRRDDKAHEHGQMADHHREKADGLRRQLDRSIFSDDVDAVEQLEAKAQELEERRAWCKRVNAAWRKAKKPAPDDGPAWERIAAALGVEVGKLTEGRKNLVSQPYHGQPYPAYVSTNLGGRIRQARARIEEVKRRQRRTQEAEEAGGVIVEGEDYVTVTFSEKPERAILDALRAAGFWWRGGSWHGERAKLPGELQA